MVHRQYLACYETALIVIQTFVFAMEFGLYRYYCSRIVAAPTSPPPLVDDGWQCEAPLVVPRAAMLPRRPQRVPFKVMVMDTR
jgi:hypothetical protein